MENGKKMGGGAGDGIDRVMRMDVLGKTEKACSSEICRKKVSNEFGKSDPHGLYKGLMRLMIEE